jgi:hypothetical protein
MKIRITLFILIFIALGWFGFKELQARQLDRVYTAIAQDCQPKGATSQSELISALRACVHANSVHNMDAEFYANWRDPLKMATEMRRYQIGERKDKPHFECSTRSTILRAVLEKNGIKARDAILAKYEKGFPDHVVVEAYNRQTSNWEMHDPTYDVYFAESPDGLPLISKDLLMAPKDSGIVPCRNPNDCGWDKPYGDVSEQYLKDYWVLLRLRDDGSHKWQTFYRPDHFPIAVAAPDSEQGAYCDWKPKYCELKPQPIHPPIEDTPKQPEAK